MLNTSVSFRITVDILIESVYFLSLHQELCVLVCATNYWVKGTTILVHFYYVCLTNEIKPLQTHDR